MCLRARSLFAAGTLAFCVFTAGEVHEGVKQNLRGRRSTARGSILSGHPGSCRGRVFEAKHEGAAQCVPSIIPPVGNLDAIGGSTRSYAANPHRARLIRRVPRPRAGLSPPKTNNIVLVGGIASYFPAQKGLFGGLPLPKPTEVGTAKRRSGRPANQLHASASSLIPMLIRLSAITPSPTQRRMPSRPG